MRDGEEIDGDREEAMPYHLKLSDFSRGPLLLEALSLWLETSYSTANLVTSRSLPRETAHGLYVPPNIPPILSSWQYRQ
jgi:hypothetical protein